MIYYIYIYTYISLICTANVGRYTTVPWILWVLIWPLYPVRIWFLKITKTYLGTIDQPRTRWDISRTWMSTSSLQWYLSLHISGRALSRHKLILLRQCHPWKKLFQNFQLICFPGNPRRHQECILSKIFFLVANRWYHIADFSPYLPETKTDTKGCPFGTGNICMFFCFFHYHIQDNLLQEIPF